MNIYLISNRKAFVSIPEGLRRRTILWHEMANTRSARAYSDLEMNMKVGIGAGG